MPHPLYLCSLLLTWVSGSFLQNNPNIHGLHRYQSQRREHWNTQAHYHYRSDRFAKAYHNRLSCVYRFLVPPGKRVLELGCGQGDLLASLEPEEGVGVDISPAMLELGSKKHPHLKLYQGDVHLPLPLEGEFHYIIMSDLVNELHDVQTVLAALRSYCTPVTRIIINFHSHLWAAPLQTARRLNLATPVLPQNWLTRDDVNNLLRLTDFEPVRQWQEILVPISWRPANLVLNRILSKVWPLSKLALAHMTVARPLFRADPQNDAHEPSVTVVVPARNEAGNIRSLLDRVPEMGRETEIIFVEGGSEDDTLDVIKNSITVHGRLPASVYVQTGTGKGDAVRLGFSKARGDILMILDADLTVPPEDLNRFYRALIDGKGELINGVRLVYPMQEKAMRFLNLLANKFFSLGFSYVLSQSTKDTLCGTKVLRKTHYESIAQNREYFGDFDPYGDFDLLFGASKQNLKISDLPIRYNARSYGEPNIRRWSEGWLLMKMLFKALRKLKYI